MGDIRKKDKRRNRNIAALVSMESVYWRCDRLRNDAPAGRMGGRRGALGEHALGDLVRIISCIRSREGR